MHIKIGGVESSCPSESNHVNCSLHSSLFSERRLTAVDVDPDVHAWAIVSFVSACPVSDTLIVLSSSLISRLAGESSGLMVFPLYVNCR